MRQQWAILGLVLALGGCVSHGPAADLAGRAANEKLPTQFVLLPYKVHVTEVGLSTVEEVPAWSALGRDNTERAMRNVLPALGLDAAPLPALDAGEQAAVDEYTALLKQVGGAALTAAAKHKSDIRSQKRPYDFRIGDGLRFLAQKSGRHAALLVFGEDYVNSTGRKLEATMFIVLFGAIFNPMAPAAVGGLVVDLDSGRLRWVDVYQTSTGSTLRDPQDTASLYRSLLGRYADLVRKG